MQQLRCCAISQSHSHFCREPAPASGLRHGDAMHSFVARPRTSMHALNAHALHTHRACSKVCRVPQGRPCQLPAAQQPQLLPAVPVQHAPQPLCAGALRVRVRFVAWLGLLVCMFCMAVAHTRTHARTHAHTHTTHTHTRTRTHARAHTHTHIHTHTHTHTRARAPLNSSFKPNKPTTNNHHNASLTTPHRCLGLALTRRPTSGWCCSRSLCWMQW
jgi:hypothetical protein